MTKIKDPFKEWYPFKKNSFPLTASPGVERVRKNTKKKKLVQINFI